jgi:hypothetical protein
MGFFKDIRDLKKQADAMTPPEHRGMMGGMRAMRDGVAQANQMMGSMQEEGQRAQHLMAHGVVGQGTITALRDTGMTVNDNPRIELDLTVTVPGREPYAVTHAQTISRLAIAGFQPGATVPVRVDPNDPAQMIIA